MGLSSLPTPSDSVMTLILANTALSISILREILQSVLHLIGLRPPSDGDVDQLQEAGGSGSGCGEPSLTDRFRSRFKPTRFGRKRARAAADCRVCLARFEPESEVDRLPCGHVFHKACLERWIDYHHVTCPLCRSHLLPPPADDPQAASGSPTHSTSSPWF